jgi:hypothetical protein
LLGNRYSDIKENSKVKDRAYKGVLQYLGNTGKVMATCHQAVLDVRFLILRGCTIRTTAYIVSNNLKKGYKDDNRA